MIEMALNAIFYLLLTDDNVDICHNISKYY